MQADHRRSAGLVVTDAFFSGSARYGAEHERADWRYQWEQIGEFPLTLRKTKGQAGSIRQMPPISIDVNVSGAISASDIAQVKANAGHTLAVGILAIVHNGGSDCGFAPVNPHLQRKTRARAHLLAVEDREQLETKVLIPLMVVGLFALLFLLERFLPRRKSHAVADRATGRQSRHLRVGLYRCGGTGAAGGAMGAGMVSARAIRSHSSSSVASMGRVCAQFSVNGPDVLLLASGQSCLWRFSQRPPH